LDAKQVLTGPSLFRLACRIARIGLGPIGVTLSRYPPRRPRFPAFAPGSGNQTAHRHADEEKAAQIGYGLYILQMRNTVACAIAFSSFKRDVLDSGNHGVGYGTG
jgi:hypothetical protein